MDMNPFPCTRWGQCCQHVHLSEETRFLDRGDGTCRHYESETRGCAIYAERPDICRVDRQYALRYFKLYTWDEYVAANVVVCDALNKLP